jgi:hypothetical protein
MLPVDQKLVVAVVPLRRKLVILFLICFVCLFCFEFGASGQAVGSSVIQSCERVAL